MIPNIIKAIEQVAEGVEVCPFGTQTNKEAICYSYEPYSDDGAVAENRLEVRIISRTVGRAESLKQKVINALVTVGDNPKNGYLACYLNGGGSLWDVDTQMTQIILYFYITTKSEVIHNG